MPRPVESALCFVLFQTEEDHLELRFGSNFSSIDMPINQWFLYRASCEVEICLIFDLNLPDGQEGSFERKSTSTI